MAAPRGAAIVIRPQYFYPADLPRPVLVPHPFMDGKICFVGNLILVKSGLVIFSGRVEDKKINDLH